MNLTARFIISLDLEALLVLRPWLEDRNGI